MKNILLAATMTAFVFSACNNAPKAPATVATPTAPAAPTAPTPAAAPAMPAAPTAAAAETTCYAFTFKKDVTAVQITTEGDKVTGYMNWSPDQKDGGHGFLVGTKTGNMIVADWTYMIEGSKNTEQIAFKIDGDKLVRAQGELIEKGHKLVIKDMAKAKYIDSYPKVDCAKVAKDIGAAKDMEKAMKKM
jgi:nucleoid-associated protein YgaU